jgi:uncharacterized alpha-E superfamily protein
MLLSRVADALYWISRYLERAEHTARVVDVAVDLGLGRAGAEDGGAILRLNGSLGLPPALVEGQIATFGDAALFDWANQNSVVASVAAARENARQVREEISADMWEQLNGLFLRVRQMQHEAGSSRRHYAARLIIEGIHLFQGITDATMGHGEGWQYLQVGRFIERAGSTSALLDAFITDTSEPAAAVAPLDQAEWVALLRSCSALEAYSRFYTADVRPERVTEFLLLSEEFPRSVRFAASSVESALLALAQRSGRGSGRVERLAGRLHASLDYAQVDEILGDDPHAYLVGIVRQCTEIHAALYQKYVTYQIESALPA